MVHRRRLAALASTLASELEPGWTVLDVGCGDGQLARRLIEQVPGLAIEGLEIKPRPGAAIPVRAFDGRRLPYERRSVDAVLIVDVLHHTEDPKVLLAEAARVARQAVIVKDHRTSKPLARTLLALMDWIGNHPHGVALPYNYWSEQRWREAWRELGLEIERYETRFGLYPWPASWLFERGLHFLARLRPPDRPGSNGVGRREAGDLFDGRRQSAQTEG